nr:hypothetical protein ANI_1_1914094 [Aspergillus niger CBS 513.88]|eukprot:XP_003188839.1 hypothetical protein ANI_1_1914094 [Aspergillus niger CBS 513.88]
MLAVGCTLPERLAHDVDRRRGDATGLLLNADYTLDFVKPVTIKDRWYHLQVRHPRPPSMQSSTLEC